MTEWTRHGDCGHCGYCCRYAASSVVDVSNPDGVSDPGYYRTRGFTLHYTSGVPVKATARVHHELVCPKMSEVPPGTPACGVHALRPQTCRDFPVSPAQVVGTPCTYWFTRGDESVGGLGSPHPTEAA